MGSGGRARSFRCIFVLFKSWRNWRRNLLRPQSLSSDDMSLSAYLSSLSPSKGHQKRETPATWKSVSWPRRGVFWEQRRAGRQFPGPRKDGTSLPNQRPRWRSSTVELFLETASVLVILYSTWKVNESHCINSQPSRTS